jgi:hypothetical protein
MRRHNQEAMTMKKKFGVAITVALLLAITAPIQAATPKAGAKCTKAGATATAAGKKFTCIKSGTKLVWNKGVTVKAAAKPTPVATPVPTSTSVPASTPAPIPSVAKGLTDYQLTKIKAYENIRKETEKDGSNNVKLVYHFSDYVSKDLLDLYRAQAIYSSKLYGTFFKGIETMNIYVYTEKDLDFLKTSGSPRIEETLSELNRWFIEWEAGRGIEHVLGGWAWYYEQKSKFEGHAGIFVFSKGSLATQRKYAIQVLPHEYFHVVQDYYIKRNPKWTDRDSWDVLFPPIFREGSANTISFALATNTPESYLELYSDFLREKRRDRSVPLFASLRSNEAVVKALYNMRTRSTSIDAHEASYSVGSLLFEWVIAEYGFESYRKIVVNQQIGKNFDDNIQASLGMTERELYEKAAPHILAAFTETG